MIIGERVRERMEVLGLSQAELARRVGVSQPSIFKLIHENKTGTTRIHKIARELQTTPAYLSGETDDPTSDLPEDTLSAEEREWVEQFRRMPLKDKAAVQQLVRTIAGSAERKQ